MRILINFLTWLFVKWWLRFISDDASREDITSTILGSVRSFDPVANPIHQRMIQRANELRVELEELRDDLREVSSRLTGHTSSWILIPALVLLFNGEALGCLLLMGWLGVENPERWVLALMLASGLFLLTMLSARRGRIDPQIVPEDHAGAGPKSTPWWFYLVLGAYSLLVLSFAVIRMHAATVDGTSPLLDLASATVALAASCGPAWVAEFLMRRVSATIVLERERRNLLREIRRRERELEKLEKSRTKIVAQEENRRSAGRQMDSIVRVHRASRNDNRAGGGSSSVVPISRERNEDGKDKRQS